MYSPQDVLKLLRIGLSITAFSVLFGCANTPNQEAQKPDSRDKQQEELGPYEQFEQQDAMPLVVGPDDFSDPLEPMNRFFFAFNDKAYRYFLTPVSSGYGKIMPKPAKQCVTNFFKNLREPLYSINFLLQGKPKQSGKSFLRLCINSTIGLFGLFDPASAWFGLEREKTNFAQTLARYGVGEGAYIVIPIIGPSTVRDGATLGFSYYVHPLNHFADKPESTYLFIYEAFHELAPTLERYPESVKGSEDAYEFVRNLYLQRKARDVKYEVMPIGLEILNEESEDKK